MPTLEEPDHDHADFIRTRRTYYPFHPRSPHCVRAYRKFAGLYNFTLLTASTDDAHASLQSRLDVSGVSFQNGVRSTRAFLQALGHGSRQ